MALRLLGRAPTWACPRFRDYTRFRGTFGSIVCEKPSTCLQFPIIYISPYPFFLFFAIIIDQIPQPLLNDVTIPPFYLFCSEVIPNYTFLYCTFFTFNTK
uniref:Uncharacterized protein n=1 Tax=Meloidogyne incognita TaxID=6306 RepID=A0A914LBG3_MELIC